MTESIMMTNWKYYDDQLKVLWWPTESIIYDDQLKVLWWPTGWPTESIMMINWKYYDDNYVPWLKVLH